MKIFTAVLTLAFATFAFVSTAVDLPRATALYAKYLVAVGGRSALVKVKSRVDHGGITLPDMGMEATYTAYTEPPNELNISDFSGTGIVKNGTTGGVSWTINPFQGNSKRPNAWPAEIFPFTNLDLLARTAKTLGEEEVDGKAAYKVEFTLPDGGPLMVYFDKESGFVVASETKNPDDTVARTVLGDYKKVGDVMIPHMLRIEGAMTLEIISETIELNAEIPAGTFDMPEEIKALP